MIKNISIIAMLILTCVGNVSAGLPYVVEPGTYISTTNTVYHWYVGGVTAHCDAFAYSNTNFENKTGQTCMEASWVGYYNHISTDNLVEEKLSPYINDYECAINRNPVGISLTRDVPPYWSVRVGSKYDWFTKCDYCAGGPYSSNTVTFSVEDIYAISGITGCLDHVSLYIFDGSAYQLQNYCALETNTYNFPVFDNTDYKLIFDDSHEYIFTVNGSNINYNYDACKHTQYRFEESCGNLIPDSEGMACAEEPELFYCFDWEAPSGIYDLFYSSIIKLELYTETFIGQTGWLIDPLVPDTEYTLINPNIAWGLKVLVINDSDGTLIDGAMVKVDQTCYCTEGYSTRQKFTVNGMVEYGDMSLQDASLLVMATGYKVCSENTTGYNVFLSGRSNFSSKTWVVKMAPTWSNNTSTFYEIGNKVDIHFRDVAGNRTSQILDTDAEVYLYYENNNTNEEAMTLKFQSSSTHTYFIDEQSWTIAHDDIGHKTIANSYFTPWDYSYRAVIYNSSIYGWNMTVPLTVRNGTRETEQHYQNLTTNLWFRHAHDGRVDYRGDMSVAIHARSNNTTLMDIDVELWDNGAYLNHVNLTETMFAGADFPYYYTWDPIYDYETGHNYTVLMYGFDRTLLETDYVECISDDTTRKNKLTIGVKDSHGEQLTNAYIHLEDWGSLHTGSVYYNAYEGVDNGDYRYKATKSGFTGGGWDEVNLTDEDKIVWYVLTEDYTTTAFSQTKFEDKDIKGIFFPLMYFLLICLILGGLKYVAS